MEEMHTNSMMDWKNKMAPLCVAYSLSVLIDGLKLSFSLYIRAVVGKLTCFKLVHFDTFEQPCAHTPGSMPW